MLIRNQYRSCNRLYWQPENIEAEADLARYTFAGQQLWLEFDGLVDDVVMKQPRASKLSPLNIEELYPAVSKIARIEEGLQKGHREAVQVGQGRIWKVRFHESESGRRTYLLQSGVGQTASFQLNAEQKIHRITLRTQAPGLTHEIFSRVNASGEFECVAEGVLVFR